MGQTWNFPMASTATLSDSRSYINDSCASLRSSFAGTSAPGTPVAGQPYFNTDTYNMSFYYGSEWKVIFNSEKTYGGLLPLTATSSYPLSGDLYLGGKQIKNLADPGASTDAVTLNWLTTYYLPLAGGTMSGVMVCGSNLPTASADPGSAEQLARKAYVDLHVEKGGDTMTGHLAFTESKTVTGLPAPTAADHAATKSYVDAEFDPSTGHTHSAAEGDAPKIEYTNLLATGATKWEFLQTNPNDTVVARQWGIDSTVGDQFCAQGTWVTVATVSITIGANELRAVTMGFRIKEMQTFGWRIRRGTTTIAENPYELTAPYCCTYGLSDYDASGGTVSYTLQIWGTDGNLNTSHAWLQVI
jgi:hypothetical protein